MIKLYIPVCSLLRGTTIPEIRFGKSDHPFFRIGPCVLSVTLTNMQMLRVRAVPGVFNMLAVAAFVSPSAADLRTSHSPLAAEINHVSNQQNLSRKSNLTRIRSDTRLTRNDGARRRPPQIADQFEYSADGTPYEAHGQELEMVDSKSWSKTVLNGSQGAGRMLSEQKPEPLPQPPPPQDLHGFVGFPAPAEHCGRRHHYF